MRPVLAALLFLLLPLTAGADTTLTRQGDHFAVNGQGRFLVIASYFDGVRRPSGAASSCDPQRTNTLACDFADLKATGVDGVRVLPNWKPPYLMAADGSLNHAVLEKLVTLVDYAADAGLVVDVTFTHETVPGLTDPESYRRGPNPGCEGSGCGGIVGATARLAGKKNVMFDLQNEWSKNGWNTSRYGSNEAILQGIRNAVKAVDPVRLVTASTESVLSAEAKTASFVNSFGFDVLTYHGPRDCPDPCGWAADTDGQVGRLRHHLSPSQVPVYVQEPNRYGTCVGCDSRDGYDARLESAVRRAKAAGAAAWTFHSDPGRDLSTAASFLSLLQPGERTFLDRLSAATHVQWGVK